MQVLTSSEKKKITETLSEQFGIDQLPYQLLQFGKERLRLFTGNLSFQQLISLDNSIRIENAGLYSLRKEEHKEGIRLTIDGTHLLKDTIKKNIVDFSDEQAQHWTRGEDVELSAEKGFVIVKYGSYFLGCGKSTGEKIVNSVPKERRTR
ncbi:MAG: hypothetical protein RL557_286 [archaeon]